MRVLQCMVISAAMVLLVSGVALATAHGNGCCYEEVGGVWAPEEQYVHHWNDGECQVTRSQYTVTLAEHPQDCSLPASNYDCPVCGHCHANVRECDQVQPYCDKRIHSSCSIGWQHGGSAFTCHKQCGNCSCTLWLVIHR